ncbi:uncharacterized protein LOC110855635 [Folsomia candida]|uniref:uncharacterized protein LOC110855635 n=1 Tax=Folsomia candida TaxID=158441 RepID=UPI000B8F5329|nr:uncharacterized protein LOC110855635 [Folsomia candida]
MERDDLVLDIKYSPNRRHGDDDDDLKIHPGNIKQEPSHILGGFIWPGPINIDEPPNLCDNLNADQLIKTEPIGYHDVDISSQNNNRLPEDINSLEEQEVFNLTASPWHPNPTSVSSVVKPFVEV